ncbi:uncharacterized protein FOMMEDRAFT_102540 [Fomitiporia mediterranea MF3/22]|uniref:uncharacterized protein n=1 Tax=Fomitiporia mediterranea (strain MF3/22) TaxID=694068 RepID=UPI0004409769|nr:uncharacterized protein FOMMEDRAFT_102540 [Fomitiporia mediterranea MF3/22]EJD06679.1 hypothetical protein FOMMEDRAFT_102540 [Fomitiporia mediterranea MF3/22]
MDQDTKPSDDSVTAPDSQTNNPTDLVSTSDALAQPTSQPDSATAELENNNSETRKDTTPSLEEGGDVKPVDLSTLGEFVYYRPSQPRVAKFEDLPPDFLEPTADDLKSAQALLASRSRSYQDAPLLTENLRNRRDEELLQKRPTATIRIRFADRSMLEKTFPSTSQIKPVYAFVRGCLRGDAKAYKFVLFEPPRRDLKVSDPKVKEKTLLELNLAPRSMLHFRFLEDDIKLDQSNGPPPLLPEILTRATDLPGAVSEDTRASTAGSSETSTPSNAKLTEPMSKDKKIARLLKFASTFDHFH